MSTTMPRASYDPESDILFVEFSDAGIVRTGEGGSVWINVDYAADGSVVAVEFVNASAGIDLRRVPRRDEVVALARRFDLPLVV